MSLITSKYYYEKVYFNKLYSYKFIIFRRLRLNLPISNPLKGVLHNILLPANQN